MFQIAVFHYAASDERGIHEALQWVYNAYHQVPRRGLAPLRVIGNIAQAVFTDAWMPEKQAYAGFVYDRSEGCVQSALPSISWTNGLSVAVPMLEAALRLHRPDIRSQAIACIQHIVDSSIHKTVCPIPWKTKEFGATMDGCMIVSRPPAILPT